MAAYIVVPVIVLTMIAIWLMVYMYDRRLKNSISSVNTTRPAATCPNVRQEGIVYTISSTPGDATNATGGRPIPDATHIRIEPDGRGAPPHYTSQNLIVVAIPRDLPPSYDQATMTREDSPNNGPVP